MRRVVRGRVAAGLCTAAADQRDRGGISLFIVVIFVAILISWGLIVDGGAKLRAASEASEISEEAARAGAGQVDRDRAYATGGRFTIDRQAATRAASSYLRAGGHSGRVAITGPRTITVTVTVTRPTTMLRVIGIGSVETTRTASADMVTGIQGPGR